MNLNNKKIIALVLTIVVLASMINLEYVRYYYNSVSKQNVNNYDECYYNQDVINVLEERAKNEGNNLQVYRSNNKMVSNCLNKYIIDSIYSNNNSFKLKYTAEMNVLFDIYFDSVFVVSYIHKKDGKI